MKALLFAGSILLALTNCESQQSARISAPSPPRRLAVPAATPRKLAHPVAPKPTLPDTIALLSRALGAYLQGYVVERFVVGDLNQDSRPDFMVVCRSRQAAGKSRISDGTVYDGRLALVLNQKLPHMQLAAVSDQEIDCLGTGCTFNGLTIKGSYFSVESLEGDCEKTYTVRTYRYSPSQHNWLLYKVGERIYSSCSYNSGEEEYHEKTRRDFGRVAFGK